VVNLALTDHYIDIQHYPGLAPG